MYPIRALVSSNKSKGNVMKRADGKRRPPKSGLLTLITSTNASVSLNEARWSLRLTDDQEHQREPSYCLVVASPPDF